MKEFISGLHVFSRIL